MSFSKAKIQRFNDTKECTPSPAKYNVNLQDKIKLGIISQNGTYLKKQPSLSGSDTGSIHSTPCFQTPPVPKKKKFLGISAFSKSKSTANSDAEELREKIVECTNKDSTIKELTDQIEELKEKLALLETEKNAQSEKHREEISSLKRQHQEDIYLKCMDLQMVVKELNIEMGMARQQCEALKVQSDIQLGQLMGYLDKFRDLHCKITEEKEKEAERKNEELRKSLEENIKMNKETAEMRKRVEECKAELRLVREKFEDVTLLTEIQMKEKLKEVESTWKFKLEKQEKESEDILKECQAISEYNIIQSEIEKNQYKNLLTEKEAACKDLEEKCKTLESEHRKILEEISSIRTEKHAYELSITTFRDTIEVLKRRLINSDRDVEQLKEELGNCEERILDYEKKLTDLTNQLTETQAAKEDLEMQYESTSKLMQNEVKTVEKTLLDKLGGFQGELKQLLKHKELLNEVLAQYHEQQSLITRAQDSIAQSSVFIDSLEKKQQELEDELDGVKAKLNEEMEEADKMRKKYIETSGKYDELAQRFEQVSKELQKVKEKNEELQKLIGPYQEQLEAYDQELQILKNEKRSIEEETRDLTLKYADILGHQNHKQKIRHLSDLKVRSSELFQKNMELEAKNFKLTRTVEKLRKEVEDVKKGGKRSKIGVEDKENLDSPKCLKNVHSPGPLKDKNQLNNNV